MLKRIIARRRPDSKKKKQTIKHLRKMPPFRSLREKQKLKLNLRRKKNTKHTININYLKEKKEERKEKRIEEQARAERETK